MYRPRLQNTTILYVYYLNSAFIYNSCVIAYIFVNRRMWFHCTRLWHSSHSLYFFFRLLGGMVMVFNTTFQQYFSYISWRSVLLVKYSEYSEKTTDLSQVTYKLYHIMLQVSITPHLRWIRTQTTIRSRPRRPLQFVYF